MKPEDLERYPVTHPPHSLDSILIDLPSFLAFQTPSEQSNWVLYSPQQFEENFEKHIFTSSRKFLTARWRCGTFSKNVLSLVLCFLNLLRRRWRKGTRATFQRFGGPSRARFLSPADFYRATNTRGGERKRGWPEEEANPRVSSRIFHGGVKYRRINSRAQWEDAALGRIARCLFALSVGGRISFNVWRKNGDVSGGAPRQWIPVALVHLKLKPLERNSRIK